MAQSSERPGAVALAETVSELCYAAAGWLLVGFGLLFALAAVTNALAAFAGGGLGLGDGLLAALWLAVSGVLVALGLFVNPRFRRRLNRRHGPTAFGRVRTVDRRVVRPEEDCTERCVDCGTRVEAGVVRRYREEYALAGVPVYTASVGYNHYCLECAMAGKEVLDGGPSNGGSAAATDPVGTTVDDRSLERR